MLGAEFLILAQGRRKMGRKAWPGYKNFGIGTFFIKGTPAQMGCGYFVILCNFVAGYTLRAAGAQW